ncbi:M16 family metallopeptidase [Pinisolibacter aquiterrae]|uniref:M16 family metallopeptidase n=1 Tax=Pinisolibacter aquiterrae TaxID=2815579 RepID=UPI001C3E60B5|nr:pitrilysin family protein [Pinisolibacter aquiterrae]MBV5266688.1 insulinase family protein [Pinisolibacter aquiterrae]MCC8234999.1 insulinase family protein [Pinisolibacter aquiterrae]
MNVEVTKLASGLTVATERMPHLETATLGVWVGAGSRSERAEEHGISHLLEHMAFKGTTTRSARRIAEEIEAVGGEINAATSVENTCYYARILADDLPLSVDILSDILTRSVFDPEELERECHVVLQEIGAADDAPEDLVFDLLQERAFHGQPIGRPILGTPQTVASFGREHLTTYLDRHYLSSRAVISAAGRVDHDEIVALVERHFAELPTGTAPAEEPATYLGGDVREVRDLSEAQVTLAFEGRPYASPDHHAAQILATVLGGGMSSRLFQEIREKQGLCYSISAFHWGYRETGLFGIHAATGEGDLDRLMAGLADEIARSVETLDEAELRRAKAQLRAGLLMSLESPVSRAGQIARQMLIWGRPLTTREILEGVEAVDRAQLLRLAGEIFHGSPATLALVGPVEKAMSADAFAARLAGRV